MFDEIKNDILGKDYSLSIAFIPSKKSEEINKKYRKKDKPTNVLSFAFSPDEGELLLCKSVMRSELKKFGLTYEELEIYLVIHGMLHLKGMEHSSRMDKAEKFYCEKYDKKHINRHRRGHNDHTGGGGRILKR